MLEDCPSGKIRYRTARAAKLAVRHLREKGAPHARLYTCLQCKGFHTTSAPRIAKGRDH